MPLATANPGTLRLHIVTLPASISVGSKRVDPENRSKGSRNANSMRRLPWAFLLLNGLFPFALGLAIYTLWRSTKLLMFRTYHQVGLYGAILGLRAHVAGFRHFIPVPILYSAPDALWVYAATALLGYLWLNHPSRSMRWFWTLLPASIAVGSEFGQLIKLVPGTFDWMDVASYVIACALATASLHFLRGNGHGWRTPQAASEKQSSKRTVAPVVTGLEIATCRGEK